MAIYQQSRESDERLEAKIDADPVQDVTPAG